MPLRLELMTSLRGVGAGSGPQLHWYMLRSGEEQLCGDKNLLKGEKRKEDKISCINCFFSLISWHYYVKFSLFTMIYCSREHIASELPPPGPCSLQFRWHCCERCISLELVKIRIHYVPLLVDDQMGPHISAPPQRSLPSLALSFRRSSIANASNQGIRSLRWPNYFRYHK